MASRRPRRPTFAELAQLPTWSDTPEGRERQSRPGGFNRAGEFFDRDGELLRLRDEDVTAEEAQRLVTGGALVAFETCGCGGGGGCKARWLSDEQLLALRSGSPPRIPDRLHAPTWIDVWANEARTVVYAHGDVAWGASIP